MKVGVAEELVTVFDEEERHVFRQVLQNAVGGLVGVDAKSGANHGLARAGTRQATPSRGENRRYRGVSKLLFQPTLAAETTGIGLNAASALAAGGKFADCRQPQTPGRRAQRGRCPMSDSTARQGSHCIRSAGPRSIFRLGLTCQPSST